MQMTQEHRTELATAAVARLLSLGFLPPSREVAEEMADLAAALEDELPPSALRDHVAALRASCPEAPSLDEQSGEHHRLFSGTVACPPYESSYAADPFQQARQMSDVAGFYRAFGAEPSGPAADRPDQVGCELEFFAYLILTRVEAERADRPDDAAVCADAEDAFLRDHLGRWLGPFCRELEKVTVHETYRALARLGQRFAVDELGRRGVTADPVLARRIKTVVESDTFSCGAESQTAAGVLDEIMGRRGPTAGG